MLRSQNIKAKRKKNRPKNSWRRDLQSYIQRLVLTWSQLKRKAHDRDQIAEGLLLVDYTAGGVLA